MANVRTAAGQITSVGLDRLAARGAVVAAVVGFDFLNCMKKSLCPSLGQLRQLDFFGSFGAAAAGSAKLLTVVSRLTVSRSMTAS
jgi:hypothetical protein